MVDIYWANSFFSEADAGFNERYASIFRSMGYSVYLPQEAAANQRLGDSSPTPLEIFQLDTSTIIGSRLLIACIDQETIDSGVACEIGIAYSMSIPVLGYYTDVRQYRVGIGKMYKNIYLLGAIIANGEVVSTQQDLINAATRILNAPPAERGKGTRRTTAVRHFNEVAPEYSGFVERLETLYSPSWDASDVVFNCVESSGARRIQDFGSGRGQLGSLLQSKFPNLFYVGYDPSRNMTELATQQYSNPTCTFTSNWEKVVEIAEDAPFDLSVLSFSLHEVHDKTALLRDQVRLLKKGGQILIIDLTPYDLPILTETLKTSLAAPPRTPDLRIEPNLIANIAKTLSLEVIDCKLHLLTVLFPTFSDIDDYLRVFGIYQGLDLPLGPLVYSESASEHIRTVLKGLAYPFEDQRVLITATLSKK